MAGSPVSRAAGCRMHASRGGIGGGPRFRRGSTSFLTDLLPDPGDGCAPGVGPTTRGRTTDPHERADEPRQLSPSPLYPDVLLGDGAVAPLRHRHHSATAIKLPYDARPFPRAESD